MSDKRHVHSKIQQLRVYHIRLRLDVACVISDGWLEVSINATVISFDVFCIFCRSYRKRRIDNQTWRYILCLSLTSKGSILRSKFRPN